MNDLISRRAVLAALTDISYNHCKTEGEAIVIDTAKTLVTVMPSAQPEIIRCKECLMRGVCRFEQGLGLDGYCSQAERRTDE